jgi:hypothetical protein
MAAMLQHSILENAERQRRAEVEERGQREHEGQGQEVREHGNRDHERDEQQRLVRDRHAVTAPEAGPAAEGGGPGAQPAISCGPRTPR